MQNPSAEGCADDVGRRHALRQQRALTTVRWRSPQLNWRYAIGELVLITAGVLIALAANQWNNSRLDRGEERASLQRLLADLETDAASIDMGLAILADKDLRLRRVQRVLTAPTFEPRNPATFLADVAASANYGWNQHRPLRTTFDELLGSGRFDLIRNPELRAQISAYYALDEQTHDRIRERQTEYPNLTYQLVPRANEYELDPNLSEAELDRLARAVYDSHLRDYVIAELNLTRFMKERFDEWRTARDELAESVRRYVETIRG